MYKLIPALHNFDPTLENCLFSAVKLTKNAGIDNYRYSGYGLGFESKSTFSVPADNSYGQNIAVFGVDMSNSIHTDNKKRHTSLG